MPFYVFDTENLPDYPPKSVNSPILVNNQKEISFNLSESFFQIPPSFDAPEESESLLVIDPKNEQMDQSSVFCIPETQYTPFEEELLVNVTADQSFLLPSISSVLEASARSARNHRRKSGLFHVPVHQRVADKLDMPSQNPNSPLLYGSKASVSMDTDLTEDSLLLALNSSVILFDERSSSNETKNHEENNLPSNKKNMKFSLDFLNTPPLNQANNMMNKVADFDNFERISTQVLLQNLDENDTQLSVNRDISLLSLDDRDRSRNFDPLDLFPNTPSEPVEDQMTEENEGHDAIFFPNSFDEANNPFLTSNPNENIFEQTTALDTIREDTNSRSISPIEATLKAKQTAGSLSNFEARLLSSISTSPGVNPQEFGLNRIVLSARKTGGTKPAPISIKSTSSSGSIGSLALSRSVSNESVPIPEPAEKSLGTRMKRVQFNKTSAGTQSIISEIVAAVTPSRPDIVTQEEKYLNHMMRSGNKRVNMIIAEPRKTPIAGIKKSELSMSSPMLKSKMDSANETPTKNPVNSSIKSVLLAKEASLASYYTDLVLSSPCPQTTPIPILKETKQANLSAYLDSPLTGTIALDSASNLNFKENQLVFFRWNNSFLVGSVVARTSKTRDIWRIKQSNGNESTVSSLEMCPVAFLRPFDEIYLRSKKVDQIHTSGPYKFKRFSPQNSIMAELHRETPQQLYDCLKLTRVSIEKEVFAKIRDRFDHGCIEDSQIRDQIMTLNRPEPADIITIKRKKRIINGDGIPESQASPTPKRSRQQQIFMDLKFLITVGDNKEDAALKEKYTRLIESHGGELLSNLPTDHEVPVIKTFLLSNGFKRTPKFMTAIIRGVPRVHFNWLESCCNQGSFVDPTSFTQFLIEPPFGCKPSGLLFKGKKFYFAGSTKFKNSWVGVIRLLGGTVSNSSASNANANMIVLVEDSSKSEKGTMNVDWLIRCVVEKTFILNK